MDNVIYLKIGHEQFKQEPNWDLSGAWVTTNSALCDEINKWIPEFNLKYADVDLSDDESEVFKQYLNKYFEHENILLKKYAKLLGTDTSPSGNFKVVFKDSDVGYRAIITDLFGTEVDICKITIRDA